MLHRLSLLSDHELGDVGLTRWDVRDAAAPGMGKNATRLLIGRRDNRRAARYRRYPF